MGSFGKDRRRRMERFLKHVSVLQAVMPAIAEENEPELSFSEGSISVKIVSGVERSAIPDTI
jgi:hypothetical protein